MDINDPVNVKRFLNGKGRIAAVPVKQDRKLQLLEFLVQSFEFERRYTEPEVNEILERFYDDYIYLRRLLIEFRLLGRDPSGSSYWRIPVAPVD